MKKLLALLILVSSVGTLSADDWLQFRGNDSSGVSRETDLPTDLAKPESLKWKSPLPGRGLSGPIVIGDRIFLTASSGYRDDNLQTLAFDAATGAEIWNRQFQATGRTICHKTMCMATPQPCSDGERIFAYYSCNDVVCYDLDGNLLWYRGLGLDYPNTSSSLGMSSSPLVINGTLLLQLDTNSESFVAGLNTLTGETLWKIDRPRSAVWASPVLYHPQGSPRPQVILQSKESLTAIDPQTGKIDWELKESCGAIPSTTVSNNLIISPLKSLTALQPTGTQGTPNVLWSEGKLSPSSPTPVVYDGRVYVLKSSVLSCGDLKTGKTLWQMRLESKNGYASPLAANGHLYLVDQQGFLQTVKLNDDKGEVVSTLELGESILCTPALAHGALYLRSDQHLWKFAN
ncbi:MAG: PQQ-binding-like beta-propeller repeat protein [Planctomycetaceae bacterium]|nr:PQQ-binding-like beta-propeller repeat protein [Planctomycetaceae bacterium]